MALGAIYGTRDAGRSFYLHARGILEKHGFIELSLERACYVYAEAGVVKILVHTHVDDFLMAHDGCLSH